jgi:hypothetical protein
VLAHSSQAELSHLGYKPPVHTSILCV